MSTDNVLTFMEVGTVKAIIKLGAVTNFYPHFQRWLSYLAETWYRTSEYNASEHIFVKTVAA
jgi:hypothetical protein